MKLIIDRETLLNPLQLVNGVIERRQTLPILSNVLLTIDGNQLSLVGTDLEIEAKANIVTSKADGSGQTTVSGRKLLDLCKALPEGSVIEITEENQNLIMTSGRSRFQLATLPAKDFPLVADVSKGPTLTLLCKQLSRLLEQTSFAMAQQDVRYYLNGTLFEIEENKLRLVATDGHRLALCEAEIDAVQGLTQPKTQLILPRKGVLELAKSLQGLPEDLAVTLSFNPNHMAINFHHDQLSIQFISKLIDGKFPDYQRVLPKNGNKLIIADRSELRRSLTRAAILSNEKYRGVRLAIKPAKLVITASNPEQEVAEEDIAIDYSGAEIEIGFNVTYLLDVLAAIPGESVKIALTDANNSALLLDNDDKQSDCSYVVMPMRL